MTKNIIFCADGTWNSPKEDENGDQTADPTNVFKLFSALQGRDDARTLGNSDEQERRYCDEAGNLVQIAKYIHGVGDSRNPAVKLLGGTFGAGVIARIVRGYTFISRYYQTGDRIYITGFSRGAYTARALAGLIVSQGLLQRHIANADSEEAYRCGAEAWFRYRREGINSIKDLSVARMTEFLTHLPEVITSYTLSNEDLVPVDSIEAVGVWDTVGAMGFPEYAGNGERMDDYRFADNQLSAKVRQGFHAIARDEQRADFTPSLWQDAANVEQLIFPGAHADVGGGYPEAESGLSDCALKWMIDKFTNAGVHFLNLSKPCEYFFKFQPNCHAPGHTPWTESPWKEIRNLRLRARSLPGWIPVASCP